MVRSCKTSDRIEQEPSDKGKLQQFTCVSVCSMPFLVSVHQTIVNNFESYIFVMQERNKHHN